jgi:hypothetical protein
MAQKLLDTEIAQKLLDAEEIMDQDGEKQAEQSTTTIR